VWSHVGRHTYGDSHRSVTEVVWEFGWEHDRLFARSIEVISPGNGILFDIFHHFFREFGQSSLGIPHGCRTISVNGPEVSLSVDERISHGPRLGESRHRVIDRRITVRVVFSHHVSDDGCRFFMFLVIEISHLLHGKEDPSDYRFESVSGIWECTGDDYRHGVVDIGLGDLLF